MRPITRVVVFLLVTMTMMASTASHIVIAAPQTPTSTTNESGLILYGDIVTFFGLGKPDNCTLRSRFKRGEPVGFRMFAADPATGKSERSATLVVHLTVGGQTIDVPMRYHGTVAHPEWDFWVAKWIVPDVTPVGTIRYTVTATDKSGRAGAFKPFANEQSQLTIVE